jgi:hypothetical protein
MTRKHISSLAILAITLSFSAPSAHAAFTDNLDGLRAELATRSLLLSNSTDKTEIKQKKACDKATGLIDKPATSLATDIKTANKVATLMIKAFPTEFTVATAISPAAVFSNSIVSVLLDAYTGLGADVQTEVTTLDNLIAGLADGNDKLKAAAQFDSATNLLALAESSLTFVQGGKLLGQSLRATLNGQAIAIKAADAGGNTNDSFVADIQIGGTNDHYVATSFNGPKFTVSTGTLDLGCTRGDLLTGDVLTPAICGGFAETRRNYAMGGGCGGYFSTSASYSMVTGTLYLATWAFTGTSVSTSGTFAFSASDGVTTIIITNGVFRLRNVVVAP